MSSVYIIAEAGVNHNGSREMAFQLVDAAVQAGADAVKFQTFKAENLVTKSAQRASYQKQTKTGDESQFSMLKRLELAHDTHHELLNCCQRKGIDFLSTAFDSESLNFLVKDIGLKRLKIPSGEITNGPLLLEHAQTGCNLIVSTGMATLDEVEEILGVISFGLVQGKTPSKAAFQHAFNSDEGRALLREKVTLLHCTSEYPAPLKDINLNAMLTMKNTFGLNVGYSDHSEGIIVPIAAASLGANIIEKHFTLDNTLPGPDHKASLEPEELKNMVDAIRKIEVVMGDGVKEPRLSEINNRNIVRKSIIAATDISKGDVFTKENVLVKRPGSGRSPMEYWDLLGTGSQQDYAIDEIIS